MTSVNDSGRIFKERERIGSPTSGTYSSGSSFAVPADTAAAPAVKEETIVGSDKPAGFDNGTIEHIEEFLTPEELYQDLLIRVRKYHPSDDLSLIEKAYRLASAAHEGQKRKSGEPYIIHPLDVAIILADLEMDLETIAAGLLHDVVEDTIYTK